MGALCSSSIQQDGDKARLAEQREEERKDKTKSHHPQSPSHSHQSQRPNSRSTQPTGRPSFASRRLLRKMPPVVAPKQHDVTGQQQFPDTVSYDQARDDLVAREREVAFDSETQRQATALELEAQRIVKLIRDVDWETYYVPQPDAESGQRTEGEHFLGNVDIINRTQLFKVAQAMPKGAHLHVHFNACLEARFLISHAKDIQTMYIRSTENLSSFLANNTAFEPLEKTRISFTVLTEKDAISENVATAKRLIQSGALSLNEAPAQLGDVYSPGYISNYWQPYTQFWSRFPGGYEACEDWLVKKCLISEEQAHHTRQTTKGIWQQFNYRTQFMKGLFSYESAFRAYTQECIFNFFHDGITYAEIRPNFMATNSVKTDCGTTSYDNFDIMRIIEEESDAAIAKIRGDGHFFAGIKVIYCHPRVFKPDQVAKALAECLEIKKQFPELLCGFDLVGEEDAGNELHNFTAEFLSFQAACRAADVEIPFLFHCGETLSSGGKVDGNLYDAILLNAKRVGHGYALARHPVLMDLFKQRGMAVECCPISNEVLGLTATAAGHHLSQLLANAVPCTLNSDNGTFYRSSLSHDFYQALVGSEAMSLLGWKQLARWSLEHSCLSPTDRAAAFAAWDRAWLRFLHFVVRTWGPDGAWSERARVVDERVRRPGHVWDPSPRPAASLSLS